MKGDIREESGVMLTMKKDFHLLDLEKLLNSHPADYCRQLQRPELVQWDENRMYVLEAKSSLPNPAPSAPIEKLKAAAEKEGCRLLSPFEQFRKNLYGKFISALVCMGEDGKHAVLESHNRLAEYTDDVESLRKMHLSKLPQILLLVLIPDMPDEFLEPMQDSLFDSVTMAKIRAFLPCCDFKVVNASGATCLKLARPL